MTNTINTPAPPPSLFEMAIAFTPATPITFTYTNYLSETITLTGESAHASTVLTFTATATLDGGAADLLGTPTIVSYRWDFGDGTVGYGNPVTHSYQLTQPCMPVIVRATDSFGRVWGTRVNVYLD